MTNREKRWEKIKNVAQKMRNIPGFAGGEWALLIPSVRGGYEALTLPCGNKFKEVYDRSVTYYDRWVEECGEDAVKFAIAQFIVTTANDNLLKCDKGKVSFMLWMTAVHFTKDESAGEIFHDEKIVMVDVNLVEVSSDSKRPTIH